MPKINKTASGLLLYEDFHQNSLIWTPSPDSYENITFGEDGLKIQHSSEYKTITLNQPDTNFTFLCKINHRPIDANDVGGVIIMSNDTFYAECQSYVAKGPSYLQNVNQAQQQIEEYVANYLDRFVEYSIDDDNIPDKPEEDEGNEDVPPEDGDDDTNIEDDKEFVDVMYPYFKISKLGNQYTFLASTDGNRWIEVGNTELPDSNRIGFFLHSVYKNVDTTNSHFYIEYAVIYSNNYVIIDNVKEYQTIILRDENGNIICDSTSKNVIHRKNRVLIDTTLLNLPINNARLTVLEDNEFKYDHEITQLIGGDAYSYNHNIKLYIDNQEIDQEEVFDLGAFYHNGQTIRLDIYNHEEFSIKDLKINITSYSFYYGGNETIEISLYDENETNYKFDKSVTIPEIRPSEGKSILIRLSHKVLQDFYKKEGRYRFKINIE